MRQREGATISHNRQSDSKAEDLTTEVSGEERREDRRGGVKENTEPK